MSFRRRTIEVTIKLGAGSFGEDLGDQITLSGHRIACEIMATGGALQGTANVRIYGLTLDTINRLTTIGPTMTEIRGKNSISITAGNVGEVLTQIYLGTIDTAYADFQAMPEVVLNISALSAAAAAVRPVPPSSFQTSASVSTIMRGLAELARFDFEDNNVTGSLANPYFSGTALDQIKACSRDAGIDYYIDRGVLAITPKNVARGGEIPTISPATGMVGYPMFSSQGLSVTCEFQPTVRLGGKINVETSLTAANGNWNVFTVMHSLECENRGGPWFTVISGYRSPIL